MKQGTIKALGTFTLGAAAVVAGSGSAAALGAGTHIDGEGVVAPVVGALQQTAPMPQSAGAPAPQPAGTGTLPMLQGTTGGSGGRQQPGDLLGGLPLSTMVPQVGLASVSTPGLIQ
ncbi:hypothetical protein [Streptomyces sp. NPDC018031]|uniref:hypothetical protein n=1 Tax=Streptomyces sp. NPDC018031 TaxID=3365033 RepID=UPI003795B5F8